MTHVRFPRPKPARLAAARPPGTGSQEVEAADF